MIEPIHTGTILVGAVRFFLSPLDDGRPDLPWHAQDDLRTALGLPPRVLKALQARTAAAHPDATCMIGTAEGLAVIAPNFAAMDLVLQVIDGRTRKLAIADHLLEATAALKALVATMPPAGRANYALAALTRWPAAREEA